MAGRYKKKWGLPLSKLIKALKLESLLVHCPREQWKFIHILIVTAFIQFAVFSLRVSLTQNEMKM